MPTPSQDSNWMSIAEQVSVEMDFGEARYFGRAALRRFGRSP
jgi:hypothetical protein